VEVAACIQLNHSEHMTSNKPFQFEITHSELRWLAEVLGYVQFPFLGVPNKNESDTDLEAEMKMAQAKMQERGLATYLPGAGWQVERLVIALTQMIANPDSVQMLQTWKKNGTTKRAFVYPNLDVSLFAEETNALEFTFHSGPSGLVAQKQAFFGLPTKIPISKKKFHIPASLIHLIMTPKAGVLTASLEETGFDKKKATELTNFLGHISLIGIQTIYNSTEGDLCVHEKKCLIYNNKGIWGGVLEHALQSIEFIPLKRPEVFKWLGHLQVVD